MLPPGHIAAGYLVATAVVAIGHPPLAPDQINKLIMLGTFFAFAPDLDMFYAFWRARSFTHEGKNFNHRQFISHSPLIWLAVALVIMAFSASSYSFYLGLLLWLGSWSHFVLDSGALGVRWFYPFSKRFFALRNPGVLETVEAQGFFKHWYATVRQYRTSHPIIFLAELSVVVAGLVVFLFLHVSLASAAPMPAAVPTTEYYRATVLKVSSVEKRVVDGVTEEHQKSELQIMGGSKNFQHIFVDQDGLLPEQAVKAGDSVIIANSGPADQPNYFYVVDKYRSDKLMVVAVLFFLAAAYFGRKRGFTSIIGMMFSILVIFFYIIPTILHGGNAFLTCISGSFFIILLSLYLSHGFNRRTTIALLSSATVLVAAIGIDFLFVYLTQLNGNGTEEAVYLQLAMSTISLRGVLLGGIIIGVLGVLDDVTTGQAAAVEEISMANNQLVFSELYRRGLSVGREHIASLINTLILAYVGAFFPLLLLYVSQKSQPLWVTLNSSFIAEEIVRTLVGSTVLILAVPLTTLLAAYFYTRHQRTEVVH